MNSIELLAPAKINLSLDVIDKRADGYHTLEMIMQSVSLFDKIIINKSDIINVSCDNLIIPKDKDNICYKAAKLFFEVTGLSEGANIYIEKKIPVAAGLAGGSTDAAAVLTGLNTLYNTKLSNKDLAGIGLKCGADVPFCLVGGTVLAKGIGEELTILKAFSKVWLVLVKPSFSVCTAWVFNNFRLSKELKRPNTKMLLAAIENNDIITLSKNMRNVLESVTITKHPEIELIKKKLKDYGAAGSLMSGSGPSVFGLFINKQQAETAYNVFREKYKETYMLKTLEGGIEYV